jgi:succinyl-diaminopimelate desuccinylase
MKNSNEIDIAQKLIRCKSIAPNADSALKIVEKECKSIGFKCIKLKFSEKGFDTINNLYVEIGSGRPHLTFAGHVDVVPANKKDWSVDPFGGKIKNGFLIGRGAVDMKSAIACFILAVRNYLEENKKFKGKISMLITGDEETYAVNGTKKILRYLKKKKIKIDNAIVGEPTNLCVLGDQIKIGRRGGLNGIVTVKGKEGHSAWPNRTKNPVSALMKMLANLTNKKFLDKGTKHFQPSIISVTSIDVGNKALNVIPAKAVGAFNIRFNPLHTTKSLTKWIKKNFNKVGFKYSLKTYLSGNAFLTKPGKFSDLIRKCVKKVTKRNPKYATDGGTSDARFINAEGINVVEFGLVGKTMHTNSEQVSLKDLKNLTKIYKLILEEYFK